MKQPMIGDDSLDTHPLQDCLNNFPESAFVTDLLSRLDGSSLQLSIFHHHFPETNKLSAKVVICDGTLGINGALTKGCHISIKIPFKTPIPNFCHENKIIVV